MPKAITIQPLYPPASNHLDNLDELKNPNVHFLGVLNNKQVIACGAVKLFTGYGEIKRVYVPPHLRGMGIAKKLMTALEQILINNQHPCAKLETGIYQPEAIGLYRALGYQHCTPFGDYNEDPMSIFMQKKLIAN